MSLRGRSAFTGCGWPSFPNSIEPASIDDLCHTSHGMIRTEVRSTYGDKLEGSLWLTKYP